MWIPIVVGAALLFLIVRPAGCSRQMALSTPEGVERELLADPDNGKMFAAFKETYPDDFDTLTKRVAGRIEAGTRMAEVAAFSREYLIATQERHRGDMAQAPAAELIAMHKADAELIRELHASAPQLCASYGAEGKLSAESFPPAITPLVQKVSIKRWYASAAGRDHPVGYKKVEPRQADVTALFDAMRRSGISEADLKRFQDQPDQKSWPTQSQCEIVHHLAQALIALPPAQSERLLRWMVV